MTPDGNEHGNLDRRVSRLANERAALYGKAGAVFGLSRVEQQRLIVVERELDECFVIRRRERAARDARRFARDGLPARGASPRPSV